MAELDTYDIGVEKEIVIHGVPKKEKGLTDDIYYNVLAGYGVEEAAEQGDTFATWDATESDTELSTIAKAIERKFPNLKTSVDSDENFGGEWRGYTSYRETLNISIS